jgi:hypothetical protein
MYTNYYGVHITLKLLLQQLVGLSDNFYPENLHFTAGF